jgi:hypothetical protein
VIDCHVMLLYALCACTFTKPPRPSALRCPCFFQFVSCAACEFSSKNVHTDDVIIPKSLGTSPPFHSELCRARHVLEFASSSMQSASETDPARALQRSCMLFADAKILMRTHAGATRALERADTLDAQQLEAACETAATIAAQWSLRTDMTSNTFARDCGIRLYNAAVLMNETHRIPTDKNAQSAPRPCSSRLVLIRDTHGSNISTATLHLLVRRIAFDLIQPALANCQDIEDLRQGLEVATRTAALLAGMPAYAGSMSLPDPPSPAKKFQMETGRERFSHRLLW